MKTITYDDTKYTLVPIEPNLEMVIAGENYIGRHAYKAMLAAAPTPTTEAQAVEPVGIVTLGTLEHGPVDFTLTAHGFDSLPDGETKLFTTPPNHREAMQMALEALERQAEYFESRNAAAFTEREAIAALKEALGKA